MSPSEVTDEILSETEAAGFEQDNARLVPVAESIRYRKRAQSAEKKAEVLVQQLAQTKSQVDEMAAQLRDIRVEQELTRKLAAAGVIDLEAAVVLAKAETQRQDGQDLDGVIEQLRKEKQYLFSRQHSSAGGPGKTSGAKEKLQDRQAVLERTARRAAVTGSRADLQKYLRLRRDFV